MVGNLAPLIPALFTGPNGERLTADQIKRRQEIAESLMAQATDTSPNAGGWASILAKGVQGFAAGRERRSADNASSTNAAESQKRLSSMLGIFTGGAPASSTTPSIGGLPPAVSTGAGAELAATSPGVGGSSVLPASFLSAVDRNEGAGAYDTLFGHAQKNGPFAGTSVSTMPISDVLAFADPSGAYGQHVKGQVGRVATPMGRYQIVGTTLRNAVGELGLDPNTPFNAQTQDMVAAHLAKRRISGADTMQGKISALRSEWEGFKNVPDNQMQQIVADLESGVSAAPVSPVEVASLDPSAGMSQAAPASTGYTDTIAAPNFSEPPREIAAAPSVAQALVQPSAPVAPPVQMAQPSIAQPQINPVVIEALTSQYASPEERQVAQMLFSDFQQEKDRAEKQALAQQQRAAEIARRQAIAQQTGIDPSYAADDDIWKGAAGNLFAPPSTSTVNGAVIDNRTGQPIYQAPAETYRQVYGDEAAAMGLDPSKAYNIGPDGKISPIGEGGVTVNNNMGNDKFGEEFAKLDANALGAVSASGLAAQRNIGRINQLDELLKSSPTGFEGALAQRAGEWGIKTEGLDTIQAAQAAINSLVPEQRQPGSGPMSDADLALFKQSLPRIINQPGGNQLIIGTMRSIAQYDAEGAQIVQQLRNNEIDRAQAFQMLQSRPNPLESFKVPAQQENPLPPQTNGRKTSTGATWEVLD